MHFGSWKTLTEQHMHMQGVARGDNDTARHSHCVALCSAAEYMSMRKMCTKVSEVNIKMPDEDHYSDLAVAPHFLAPRPEPL